MTFVKLERVRAQSITRAILSSLQGLGLSTINLLGPGYDSTATMSGEKSGV